MPDKSITLGLQLAQLQHYLAEEWNDQGPEHVWELLDGLTPETRRNLLMANISQTAAILS